MNTRLILLAALPACFLTTAAVLARDLTLSVGGTGISEVTIGTNETAQVASWFPIGSGTYTRLDILKDGLTHSFYSGTGFNSSAANLPPRIAGPAVIRLVPSGGAGDPPRGLCTVQIEPATFPPDKTVIVPADTGGANIVLEASTNLIHWTTATPGVYTNLHTHMFFRIRAERLP